MLLVQHVESGEKFVLKQIPISERSAEKESAAFSEVDVLSRLSHPNITTLYGAWRSGSVLNILMEFADRGSLADVLKAKAGSMMLFDEDAILDWFVQIVAALRAMHARSILHRDLKAANVFLTSRNLIKVGDFGISKMLEKNGGLASTTIGTPYYLAPEVSVLHDVQDHACRKGCSMSTERERSDRITYCLQTWNQLRVESRLSRSS